MTKQFVNEVSVFCLTYNHVRFIEQAIEGIVNQKTSFRYNLFIYDDASTDGTSDIIRRYAINFPDIVNAYISPVNLYQSPMREEIMMNLYRQYLDGKYIAWCEGDDYWTDKYKLQRQYDILENDENCSMVTHAFTILNCHNNSEICREFSSEERRLSLQEIILKPYGNLATASLFMRREVFFPEKGFPKCDVEDIPMQFRALLKGYIYYIPQKMSVYRYMHDGSWSQRNSARDITHLKHVLSFISFLDEYNIYSGKKFQTYIWKKMVEYLYDAIETCAYNEIKISKMGTSIRKEIWDELCRVYSWFSGEPNEKTDFKAYAKEGAQIYVMGYGKYSSHISKSLNFLGIPISGYVVSKKETNEKGIYELCEIKGRKVIVLVGISQLQEDDIVSALADIDIMHIFAPIWFDKQAIFVE